ncbi:histidine kinase [Lysinibacillus sp. KU-BSD001]|uniref:histidine kinase n=1 Tax=Lysinibacillus sp. KU-BSD001 TaxID=3141328 RepID=UPI0036E259DE
MKNNIWSRYGILLIGSFFFLLTLRLIWLFIFYPIQIEVPDNTSTSIDYALIENDELLHLQGSNEQPMHISLDSFPSEVTLMFYIPKSEFKTEVFVNDRLISQPSEKFGTTYSAYLAEVTIDEPNFTLTVSSNENKHTLLFHKPIIMSSIQGLTDYIDLINTLNLIILITLLLNITYSVFIYLFIYRNRIVLIYSIMYIFPFLDEIYRFVNSLWGDFLLPYSLEAKLTSILYLCTAFCIVRFAQLLPVHTTKLKYQSLINGLFSIFLFILLIIPLAYKDFIDFLLIPFYIISVLYTYRAVWRVTVITVKETYFLLFAGMAACSGLLWRVIKSLLPYELPFYPFDYLSIEIGIACFWFYRFFITNEQIKLYAAKLQQRDQMKEDFLRQSSERLYNPLNSLIFELENDKVDLAKLKSIVRMMNFSLGHLFDYTQIQNETIHIEKKSIAVTPLLSYLLSLLQPFGQANHITLTFNNPNKLLHVMGDEQKLSQVFINLLNNVLIKLKNGSEITIEVQEQGDYVSICMSGMSNEVLEELDQLTIEVCHQILAMQQGELIFNPFMLEIRLLQSVEKEHWHVELDQSVMCTEYKGKILLWSENHADNAFLLALLSSQQYQLTLANESNFWTHLKTLQYDLVIIDSMIAAHSSLDIIKEVRQNFSFVQLPILFLTVQAHNLELSTIFKSGVNDYISKPIQPMELLSRTKSLITMKQMVENELHLEAELLRAQIEPHFLFNTLNTIASLSTIDQDKMVDLLHEFGNFLSSLFDARIQSRMIPLSDEIELVKSFAFIQEQRFMPNLKIVWVLNDTTYDAINIPPFSLQTLVENAIRHGVHPKGSEGTVTISIWKTEQQFFIRVADNGVGIPADKLANIVEMSSGLGLRNTLERLRHNLNATLQIDSTEGLGTICTISIPLHYD